jgi:hypothetical protein
MSATAAKLATAAELRAHYRAVRARLDSPRRPAAPPASAPSAAPRRWSAPATPVEIMVFRRTGWGRALADHNESLRALFATGRSSRRELIEVVAAHFGVTRGELLGARGRACVAHARHVAMYMYRRELGASTMTLGGLFRRDHTTVIQGAQKIAAQMEKDPAFAAEVAGITTCWREGAP